MPSERGSSLRTNLVDITYEHLYYSLINTAETQTKGLLACLSPRKHLFLDAISGNPFGSPNPKSKAQVETAKFKLPDGVECSIESFEKPYIFAISSTFSIDEIQAVILFRSFLFNKGLPPAIGQDDEQDGVINDLLEAILPFYHSERTYLYRCLMPLFRYKTSDDYASYTLASEFFKGFVADETKLVLDLLKSYKSRLNANIPSPLSPVIGRKRWAQQNQREILHIIELLFYIMWTFSHAPPTLVYEIFNTIYTTNAGASINDDQELYLVDDQGKQISEDITILWILIGIEILGLDNLAGDGGEKLTIQYLGDPDQLTKIHQLVVDNHTPTPKFSLIFIAWSFVLRRLLLHSFNGTLPETYSPFIQLITPHHHGDGDNNLPLPAAMIKVALQEDVGSLQVLAQILDTSPLFVTGLALKSASWITEPNSFQYRSLMKDFLTSLVTCTIPETIPNLEALFDVWISLFGHSEPSSIAAITHQFWSLDFSLPRPPPLQSTSSTSSRSNRSRPHQRQQQSTSSSSSYTSSSPPKVLFDFARSRFPIYVRPLVRLLRSMTGSGFDLSSSSSSSEMGGLGMAMRRESYSNRRVFEYFEHLETYTMLVPLHSSSPSSPSSGLFEVTTPRGIQTMRCVKSVRVPGGTVLGAKCVGGVLSDTAVGSVDAGSGGGVKVPVQWHHQHSGWKVIMDILTAYVYRQSSGMYTRYPSSVLHGKDASVGGVRILDLVDVGVMEDEEDMEDVIVDCLDLMRSVVQGNRDMAEEMGGVMDDGGGSSGSGVVVSHLLMNGSSGGGDSAPDLIQLTTMILESALRKVVQEKKKEHSKLITATLAVLTCLLPIPRYSSRIWLFLRHTSILFERPTKGGGSLFGETILSREKVMGQYPALLVLLDMVQSLFIEATQTIILQPSGSMVVGDEEGQKMLQIKEEVLIRAARFIHTQVWVEYFGGWGGGGGVGGGGGGWKFLNLSERFEVGRRIVGFYVDVLEHSSPLLKGVEGVRMSFESLSNAISDAFLYQATTTTIHPLVHLLASGRVMLTKLYETRRFGDVRRLILSLATHLKLVRLVLNIKQQSPHPISNQQCLLEQVLCSPISTSIGTDRVEPVDIIASYALARDTGRYVPLEATRVLYTLCSSLSLVTPAHHNIIGHLANPETIVSNFVTLAESPYSDVALRGSIWNFVCLSMDKEPALATLFISGKPCGNFGMQDTNSLLPPSSSPTSAPSITTALTSAHDSLQNWEALWDQNPPILSSVLQFFDVSWQHAHEHKATLEPFRQGKKPFWSILSAISKMELGPVPEFETMSFCIVDSEKHSNVHQSVSFYSYRTLCKSYAIHIFGLDLALGDDGLKKSFESVDEFMKSEEDFSELTAEAAASAYEPHLHDTLTKLLDDVFPGVHLEQLRLRDPVDERDLGDQFVFSLPLLRSRLSAYGGDDEKEDEAERQLMSENLNLSLDHAQNALSQSFQYLIRQYAVRNRGDDKLREMLLSRAASVSYDLGKDSRTGDKMSNIYGTRMGLLLSILELAWVEPTGRGVDVKVFADLVQNVEQFFVNEAQPPEQSILRKIPVPFHRTLLLITYFCAKQSIYLARQVSLLHAEQRLKISSFVERALSFLAESLAVAFKAAVGRVDLELDQDMEIMVAAFDLCINPVINPSSPTRWLAKCSATDLIRSSLELFTQIDVSGLQDPSIFFARKHPLYSPHILIFHMALSRVPLAAERLANDGLMAAYSNNSMTQVVRAGAVDVALSEIPGDRSPAHGIWTNMLSVAASVVASVGRHNHYFDSTACAFVQLNHDQIVRALSWTNDDVMTLPLMEEIEQVVNLFFAISDSAPRSANPNPATRKVLDLFSDNALYLLQQFNYALTHPNHLATLLEPVTPLEKRVLERSGGAGDLSKNTLFIKLLHTMYRVTSGILHTLNSISRADVVLVRDDDEWSSCDGRVLPQSKVVVNEPASQGTLIELGNVALTMLRDLSARPPAQSLYPSSAMESMLEPLDARSGMRVVRRCLESALLYSVAQLTVSLMKTDAPNAATKDFGTDEIDDVMMDGSMSTSTQRKPRRSATLAERMRRGMPAEVTAEIQALLLKAKPVLSKSGEVLSGEKSTVELCDILGRFLSERAVVNT